MGSGVSLHCLWDKFQESSCRVCVLLMLYVLLLEKLPNVPRIAVPFYIPTSKFLHISASIWFVTVFYFYIFCLFSNWVVCIFLVEF